MAPIFKDMEPFRFFDKAELAKLTPEELDQYENRLKNYRDLKSVIQTAFDDGKLKGRLEGLLEVRLEWRLEGKLEVARKLKASGVAKEIIISTTGLSEKDLENL